MTGCFIPDTVVLDSGALLNNYMPENEVCVTRTFRITKGQDAKLLTDYKGKGSLLIRALLEKFFKGEIKDVKIEHRFN